MRKKTFNNQAFRAAREELGLTQDEAAARIGISRGSLSKLEQDAQPKPETIRKIVVGYGFPAERYSVEPSIERGVQLDMEQILAAGATARFEVTIRRLL